MASRSQPGAAGELRVLQILRGSETIESWDLAQRAGLMDNTSNKYVMFLRDKGHTILTERIEGKSWCRYRYISAPSAEIVSNEGLAERCLKIAAEYPEGHPQRKAIMQQHEELTARK